MSKALLVLKIFKFLPWLFVHAAEQLHKKDQVNFKFNDVTAWFTSNCNTHIPQYIERSKCNQTVKVCQLTEL